MSEAADGARIVQAYRDHRPYLTDLAFRMLGDIGAAEDTVQDAFARLLAADVAGIDDERGWLIVVTSRLCLDRIRSARARRERPHDSAGIEFVAPPAQGALTNPADRVTLDDSVSLALLVVLQRLSPAERVVFVLHDIFSMPFPTVAQTVGRTAPACRQLAKRARQKIAAGHPGQGPVTEERGVRPSGGPPPAAGKARFEVAGAEHRAVTEKFIAACANGDLDGLLAVLAPDAWGDIDFGPGGPVREVAHGAALVARNLLRFWGPATLVSQPLAGQPALLGFRDRDLAGVLVLGMRGEAIESVHVIADPGKLAVLGLQLSAQS
jgi:RNA polymerase sigma-70 factor, ECF subfamily